MKFTKNNEFNSLEISFEEKPSEKVREIVEEKLVKIEEEERDFRF